MDDSGMPPLLSVTVTDEGEALNTLLEAPLSPGGALRRSLRKAVNRSAALLPPRAEPLALSSEALAIVVSVNLDILSIALQNVPRGPSSQAALSAALCRGLPGLGAGMCERAAAARGPQAYAIFLKAVKRALVLSGNSRLTRAAQGEHGARFLAAFLQLMTVRVLEGAAKEVSKDSALIKARHVLAAMDKDAGLKSLLAPAPGAKPDAQGGGGCT
jgi:hypothetical protein